jgi:hypothetical protein
VTDVAVVIATRDRRERLLATLGRIGGLPERPPLVVVDNGSCDGTADAVRRRHPDDLGHRVGDVRGPLECDSRRAQALGQCRFVPGTPERRGAHRLRPVAEVARHGQRGAERRARVARRRLDPHPLERALPPQPRIGHAVEGDAARERDAGASGRVVQPAGEL